MAFELEALVGHLYVAGGRTIRTQPPGALCEVAPKRAARGREMDTFFVLVLPSGTTAPNTFYEQMALMASERYFSQKGSVTTALRDVFNALNNNLYEHNHSGRRHYEANMIAAVLRGDDLYIARTGASCMILWQRGDIITYPDDITDDDALFMPPLGVQAMPEVEMTRYAVQKDARLLLTDANIVEITRPNLRRALEANDIEALLDDFKTLVTLQIQMMAVEFVPPEESVMVPAAVGESSAVLSAEIAAARAKASDDGTDADKPPNKLQEGAKQVVITTSRSAGHGFSAIGELLQKLAGSKPTDERKRLNNTLITTAVIGFPVVIIFFVVVSWVSGVGETAFEECVGRVVDAAEVARSIDPDNRNSVVTAWQGTLRIIENDCDELNPGHNDPTLETTRTEAQRTIDDINQISRRRVQTLMTLPVEGANIGTLVIKGLDLYAFDEVNNLVYRMQIGGDGMSIAGQPQPITSMRQGATVDGLPVGEVIDIAFDNLNNQIVALAENGVLINCPPSFINRCEAQRILGSERWENPIKLTMWQGSLYILDTGAQQIWRYQPSGGSFASPPTEYFTGSIRPAYLSNAVDFAIAESGGNIRGKVWILYNDGVMTQHLGGQPEDFSFSPFPNLSLSEATAQAMYLNENPVDTSFYFVSRPTRTIYKTTLAGSHQQTYRIFDEELFERLNDVVVDSGQDVVYAASGNSIFAFPQTIERTN